MLRSADRSTSSLSRRKVSLLFIYAAVMYLDTNLQERETTNLTCLHSGISANRLDYIVPSLAYYVVLYVCCSLQCSIFVFQNVGLGFMWPTLVFC